VASDQPIFVVEETGDRTVVSFRDWQSSMDALYWSGADVLVFKARTELEGLIDAHQAQTLVVDMSSVNPLPSSLLGLLISLSKNGVQVELLRPSPTVREALAVTKLDQFFTIQE
jgi:hypothetical protein